ncbi:MAG: RNA polymerase sigma-54 factor, partial [Lysobacterales bacterium]
MANQSLQLRLTQKLSLAPQLQQAIRLLQLTRIELREYIQETVDANPLLDHDDGTDQNDEQHDDSKQTETSEYEEPPE